MPDRTDAPPRPEAIIEGLQRALQEVVRERDEARAEAERLREAHEQIVRLCDAPWSPEGEHLRRQAIRDASSRALNGGRSS